MAAELINAIDFRTTGPQRQFLQSTGKYTFGAGGYGAGKSKVAAFATLIQMLANPGVRGGLIGADYGRLARDVLPVLYEVLDKYGITRRWVKSEVPGLPARELLIGEGWLDCTLDIRSIDAPEAIKGPNWGYAIGDEITLWPRRLPGKSETIWTVIQSRLRIPGATNRFFGVGTPEGRSNWTNDPGRFERPPEDPSYIGAWRRNYRVIRMPTRSNPALDRSYADDLESSLDPQQIAEKLNGIPTAGAGASAYYEWDPARNIQPVNWDIYRGRLVVGMDFNVNPMTAILAQFWRNTLWVFGELYLENSSTPRMAKAILDRIAALGLRPSDAAIYPDASGRSRKTTGESDFDALRGAGLTRLIYPEEGNPRVTTRLHAVNGALSHLRIVVDPRCKMLIRDLGLVETNDHGELIDSGIGLTHISDALGYVVIHLLPIRRPSLGFAG